MILILSVNYDQTTSHVINWLLYNNIQFTRINEGDLMDAEINLSNNLLMLHLINGTTCKLNELTKYWYRRGHLIFTNRLLIGENDIVLKINNHKNDNNKDIAKFIHSYLQTHINSVGSCIDNSLNKLTELTVAKKIGILIPDTLITTCKQSALNFINTHKNIITKPIKRSLNLKIDDANFYWNTIIVAREDIEQYPETFSPIKLQSYIDKAFELRVFYLEGVFYASAIFSQNDEQTKIDFRNYNDFNPNRVIPYNLPKEQRIKFKKLMQELNLKSGSLDIVVTKSGDYVFLEVNPIGQFSQVSKPCNYYLEKQMAMCLAN